MSSASPQTAWFDQQIRTMVDQVCRELDERLKEPFVAMVKEQAARVPDGRFVWDENARKIIERRYLSHESERPEDWLARVAARIAVQELCCPGPREETDANARSLFAALYRLMLDRKFLPAGRTTANADHFIVPNCVVMHIQDTMKDIFGTLNEAALLQQRGSGLGFPFHLLRPAGFATKISKGTSSGPVSFLRNCYNSSFLTIKQHNRHGANMAVMNVTHPDILEFIHCKDVEGELTCFNCSVGLTDEFMKAALEGDPRPWMCEWKGEKYAPRRIKRDSEFRITEIKEEKLTARQIFDEIIDSAWRKGEPGVVFPDRVNATNPLPGLGRIESCNPCGEQFLHDRDVCNLGSLNLAEFVNPDTHEFDMEALKAAVPVAVQALDNVVDTFDIPSERVQEMAKANRRIGLGVMGVGKALCRMLLPYDSAQGRAFCSDVMRTINEGALATSRQLARRKGTFPNVDLSIYAHLPKDDQPRNAALTTCAPTGTISNALGTSGGVEPHFALAYFRKFQGKPLAYLDADLLRELKKHGFDEDSELVEEIIKIGSIRRVAKENPSLVERVPEEIVRGFPTAMDITAEDHILMQAAFQAHTDNSISKTINYPNGATREDIFRGYCLAWKTRCKGCTVYRDGSRNEQVLNLNTPSSSPMTERNAANGSVIENKKAANGSVIENKKAANGSVVENNKKTNGTPLGEVCPDCKTASVVPAEGCKKCMTCGYGLCS